MGRPTGLAEWDRPACPACLHSVVFVRDRPRRRSGGRWTHYLTRMDAGGACPCGPDGCDRAVSAMAAGCRPRNFGGE